MTTSIQVYNWSGVTVDLWMSDYILYGTHTVAPNGPAGTEVEMQMGAFVSAPLPVAVNTGTTDYVPYTVQTDSQATGSLYILSNNQFPPPSALQCTGSDGQCDNYSYSRGYGQAESYIIQGGYYSPATSYRFPSSATVVEVAGQNHSGLTLVADAFNPVVGSGGDTGSVGDPVGPDSPETPCDMCSQCSDCPGCPGCEEGDQDDDSSGSTWYWWVIGVVVVLLLLLSLAAGGWYLYRRQSQQKGKMTDETETEV